MSPRQSPLDLPALLASGDGETTELVALAREIAGGVRETFGVELVPEPVFVGHSW